jgi:hypothetical protein
MAAFFSSMYVLKMSPGWVTQIALEENGKRGLS